MGPRSPDQVLWPSLQHYYVLGKSPWSEAQMEDLVNSTLLCSIWGDGVGRDLDMGLYLCSVPSSLTWVKPLLDLCPISKMEVIIVQCKPLAQSLPCNRCLVSGQHWLMTPASTRSDSTHFPQAECPFWVCPAPVTGRWVVAGERGPESGKRRGQHTPGAGLWILAAHELGWPEVKGRVKAQSLYKQLKLGQDQSSLLLLTWCKWARPKQTTLMFSHAPNPTSPCFHHRVNCLALPS